MKRAKCFLMVVPAGIVATFGLASCQRAQAPVKVTAAPPLVPIISQQVRGAGKVQRLEVTSTTFKDNGPLPKMVTALGTNFSPDLRWSKPPANTACFVIVVEDMTAPGALPYVHWMVANLPRHQLVLPYGVGGPGRKLSFGGAVQGTNDAKTPDYFGPKPPPGTGTHQYIFQVLAVKSRLNLKEGFDRATLLKALNGQVVASGKIVGKYTG